MMIIWLNGAFGAGKTTIAHELQQKLPNAIIYDPEIIGSALMELVPEEMKENDFQEYQEWRCWNAHLLKRLSKASGRPIIVPMTLYKNEYEEELIGYLRRAGIDVYHFLLAVEKEEILQRLLKRNDGTFEWGKNKLPEVLEGFHQIQFTEIFRNHSADTTEIVATILNRITE
ncbi:AAA family ATPase [Enterococcus faecalis]|uniref:AAA family ATPase n=1 Tax=Enterococcus faecalis TaxID=1351 RepID=UPI002454EDD0|nr:AAA family ATPase [Enterococcus faecalis]MDH5042113.1 AAA family ATPase [Enterococcus faecalis]